MASPRVSALLALEVENRSPGATKNQCRNSRTYPQDPTRESSVGHATNSIRLSLLGFEVAQSIVAKYRIKTPKPSSQSWKTFLSNHARDIIGIDFFTVPTATFRNLYCFIILSHERRQVVHFNVTEHPTAAWTTQQLIRRFRKTPPHAF